MRVVFSCTGVGIFNRGIESFFREAFDHLKGIDGIDAILVKGRGPENERERVVPCLPRTAATSQRLGRLLGRNGYVLEQWSSFLPIAREIRRLRPQVVFYSEANLGFLLRRFRSRIDPSYRLLFSNGGPCGVDVFRRTDVVHQVAPFHLEQALAAGEPPERHIMVPYGIRMPPPPWRPALDERAALRRRLGLPLDRQVVLSVGWISRHQKRMDYLVREIARLDPPRPFLMLLGAMDESTDEIIRLAGERLGAEGFAARSVAPGDVPPYYLAADAFALASLQEGFGRVFLEALSHGLPVLAHRHPVMEYVLGSEGSLLDLSVPGSLATALRTFLDAPADPGVMRRRWESVRGRFGWPVLAPAYRRMFVQAARAGARGGVVR